MSGMNDGATKICCMHGPKENEMTLGNDNMKAGMIKNINPLIMDIEDLTNLNSVVSVTTHKLGKFNQPYEVTQLQNSNEPLIKKFPWKYKINKYGCRGDDWNFNPSPAFFGCSFTFGIGAEYTFSYLFQEKIRKETNNNEIVVPNLGMPGASFLSIIKSFLAFSNLHPMTAAFITLPSIDRFTVYTNNKDWKSDEIIPNFAHHIYSTSANNKIVKNISRVWSDGWGESFLTDYIHLAECIAENKKIKIFWSSWDTNTADILKKYSNNVIDWEYSISNTPSRDLSHPNQDTHNMMSDIFFNQYKTYISN